MEKDVEVYSEIILELYKHPMNGGNIRDADLTAQGGNPVCGDEVRIYVKFEKGKIKEIKYTGQGCAISQASASFLTEMVKGKTIGQVMQITPEHMFEELGGIVQTRIKCALLALHVLKEGLKKYNQENKKGLVVEGIKI